MNTFEEFEETFKVMLVRRYNWTVTKASSYNDENLLGAYKKGLSTEEAYFEIFSIEQDLQLPIIP